MKLKIQLTIFFAFVYTSLTFAQQVDPPGLEFVCELKVTTDPTMIVGQTAHGERRIIPITGGTFEGPNMKGEVLAGGADYQFVNETGSRTEIEAIYSIKTDDDVLIHIRNVGLVYRNPEVTAALKAGEPIDWSTVYFRAAPKFEAPVDSPYDWLNNALFVCKGIPTGQGYVRIVVWKVL
ncbi:DUF3237 domain-containing protein [Jiulongibacter sediminis]|jgi:hypothetical protein|uniref:DUF3237 domain-containing protein n=1 Tax=Jiulongibacter sediminis TaxID=1605367 RepID=UPI0026E98D7F|nr:DUF3237 domain-containing protein [Jiulongibacter sediminis]